MSSPELVLPREICGRFAKDCFISLAGLAKEKGSDLKKYSSDDTKKKKSECQTQLHRMIPLK